MQLPFKSQDVRFISLDGTTVRFELRTGSLEVTFDSREVMERVLAPQGKKVNAGREAMYQDGIYGI